LPMLAYTVASFRFPCVREPIANELKSEHLTPWP
jgi:hypothetical protein